MNAENPSQAACLLDKKCVPCRGGVDPLKGQALAELSTGLDPRWRVVEERRLEREYAFRNFVGALDFVNRVGELAELEGHHPWIHFTYGKVRIELWTHKVDGLTENDFILAAKIDTISGK